MTAEGIGELLAVLASTPSDPAFVSTVGTRVSRGDLAERALAIAGELHRRGLGPGTTIALAVRPGPEATAVLLAALRLGVRVVAADPRVAPHVLTATLRAADISLVVTEPLVRAATGWAAPIAGRAGVRLARLDTVAPVTVMRRRLGVRPSPDRGRHHDADAIVVFTSGTTGSPRAVVHSSASMSAGVRSVSAMTGVRGGDTVVASTMFAMLPALLAGAAVATRVSRRTIRAFSPRLTYVTPPQARDLLAEGTRFTGRVFTGSAPASARLLTRVREAGADEAWCVYALTEVFPVAAVESRVKSAFDGDGDLVGDLMPGMAARTDAAGQVMLTGRAVCPRYLGGVPLAEVATGDRGVVEGRRVVLQGRCKDMVLRRAVNIYPGLYEPSLHVPGVAQAVLVGVPATDLDERLVLVVEPEPGVTEDDVHRALRDPIAALGVARPDQVIVATVPTIGRSNKPDRAAVAELVEGTSTW